MQASCLDVIMDSSECMYRTTTGRKYLCKRRLMHDAMLFCLIETVLSKPKENVKAALRMHSCLGSLPRDVSFVAPYVRADCPVHLTYPREGSMCEITSAARASSPPPSGRNRGGSTTAAGGDTRASTGAIVAAGSSSSSSAGTSAVEIVEIDIAYSDVLVCAGDRLGTVIEGPGGVPVPGGVNQVSLEAGGGRGTHDVLRDRRHRGVGRSIPSITRMQHARL